MAKTALLELNAPFLYWLVKIPAENAAKILKLMYQEGKSNKMTPFLRIATLLGDQSSKIIQDKLAEKFANETQKPNYVYGFNEIIKSRQIDLTLKCLKATGGKILNTKTYSEYISEPKMAKTLLSKECYKFFNGEVSLPKTTFRELDFLAYSHNIINNISFEQQFNQIFES